MNLLVLMAVTSHAQTADSLRNLRVSSSLFTKPVAVIKPVPLLSLVKQTPPFSIPMNVKALPADYYSQHIGFFCTKELQLEKTTKIPFRFRLGSVEYCDVLEGKHNIAH